MGGWFFVFLGFFAFSDMVRPADQEEIAIEKSLFFIIPRRRGHSIPFRATWKSARINQYEEEIRVKHKQEPLLWLLWVGMGETG